MIKSEWSDGSSSLQELTQDETFHVSGGYTGDPVNTGPPLPPIPPTAEQLAFAALLTSIVKFQGYVEFTSGPNPQLIIPAGLGGPKPPRGRRH